MDLDLFKDFFMADESFKTVGLIILWQMRGEMKSMKDAIKSLTEKMDQHERRQDERWSNHESRLIKVEDKLGE
jgi:hypothetical protein